MFLSSLRVLVWLAVMGGTLGVPAAATADEGLRVELNAVEPVQSRCRASFLAENKAATGIESLKLDLAVFNTAGIVQRRLVIELGPVRRAKTVIRAFELDAECGKIGAILVNDVTACAPLDISACLDQLSLSSQAPTIRFYK